MDGLTDYYLISFQSAADFLLTIDETKLKIDPLEFRERLERFDYAEFLAQKRGAQSPGSTEGHTEKYTSVWELLWSKEAKKWESLVETGKSEGGEGSPGSPQAAEWVEMARRYRQLSLLVEEMLNQKAGSHPAPI